MQASITPKQLPSLEVHHNHRHHLHQQHHHHRYNNNNNNPDLDSHGLLSPRLPLPDLDARPSTAPSRSSPRDFSPTTTSAFSKSGEAVRQSPTLNDIADIHVAKRPARGRRLSSGSSTAKQSPNGLLSPTSTTFPANNSRSPSISERRSPSARRPPASFSANGIETSFGPPPSLITRSNYHSDLARRAQNPAASALAAQQHKIYSNNNSGQYSKLNPSTTSLSAQSRDRTADWANAKAQTLLSPAPASLKRLDSLDSVMKHTHNVWSQGPSSDNSYSGEPSPGEQDPAIKDKSDGGIESSQSSDDLFLKLALDGSDNKDPEDSSARLERRESRGRKADQRTFLSAESETPFTRRRRNTSPQESSFSSRLAAQNASMDRRKVSGAASVVGNSTRPPTLSTEQKFNAYRSRYMQSSPQTPTSATSKASELSPYGQRRPSVPENLTTRPQTYRPSRLNYTSTRASEYSPRAERGSFQQDPRADGADSVVSTVQSAVWDEMQEPKAQFQQIEHGRRFTSSGGGASNVSAERPRTATTTVTTISSSPKLPMKAAGASPTSSSSKVGGPEAANIHPLLHQSLARCQAIVSPTLYRALENAVSDALDMAVWARTTGPQGSIYSSASAINGVIGDRQLRRKADNLCRNLTDMCIGLIESKQDATDQAAALFRQRRGSREASSALPQTPSETLPKSFSRNASQEPEDVRATPSRALERVEARRASYMGSTPPASSPRESKYTAATQRNSIPLSNKTSPQVVLRSGTALLRSRRAATEEDEEQPNARAPSRAVTEVGTIRKRSERFSAGFGLTRLPNQNYTSQHPLPQSNVLRRVTGGGQGSDTPTTPGLLRGAARRYLNKDNNALSTESTPDDQKKLKRRSLGLYTSSSTTSSTAGRNLLGRQPSLKGTRTGVVAGGGD